jgi:hypothetical protein
MKEAEVPAYAKSFGGQEGTIVSMKKITLMEML